MALHRRDRPLAADGDARLRAADQLVAGEQRHVHAGGDRVAHQRLLGQSVLARIEQRPAAEVVEQQQPALARERRQRRQRRLLGEADDAEVRGVHAQQRHGALADRLGVVAQVGAVRRADLDERRAGLAHHVGDAEAAADLDQLAARDHHLAAGAERGEREQQRRGVVVDRDPGLRACDARQQIGEVAEARSALPGVEVELDVRVALGSRGHRGDRRPRERRASEVRVDDHAARVDDAAQARLQAGGAIGDRLGGGLRGRRAGTLDLRAVVVEHLAGDPHDRLVAVALGERGHARVRQQPLDRGQFAVGVRHRRLPHAPPTRSCALRLYVRAPALPRATAPRAGGLRYLRGGTGSRGGRRWTSRSRRR